MKKVKIFLSAFTVLAFVAGALAFKANRITATVYCASIPGQIAGTPGCPGFAPSLYELNPLGLSYCTVTVNTGCEDKADPPKTNQ